jgi:hypothetical protein
MKKVFLKAVPLFSIVVMLVLSIFAPPATAATYSDLPDLSLVDDFVLFGFKLNLHNVTVNGNVGVLAGGSLALESPSTITGDLSLGAGVTTSGGGYPGNVNGTIYSPVDLSAVSSQVVTASNQVAALTPDATYTAWTSALTIASTGDVNVINVTNVNLNSQSVTFTGGPDDYFLINVFGSFDLGGSGGILAGAGMDPSRMIINIVGTGAKITTKIDNEVNGTMLVPSRQMEFHSVSGAVYGDGNNLEMKFQSGASIYYDPFTPVPIPGAVWLLGSGLIGLVAMGRRRLKK